MDIVLNTDFYLVKRACVGDKTAFEEIVETNKKKVFYLAYDLTGSMPDAEDLSQEVFLKAYRNLGNFKGEASLSSWLYRITLNAFLDRTRKLSFKMEKEQRTLEDYENRIPKTHHDEGTVAVPQNPENYAESQQIQNHIEAALQQLSPKERAVFVMRHYQEMPGKQVGELLDISEGTVKSFLFRAIKKLQTLLRDYQSQPQPHNREVYQ